MARGAPQVFTVERLSKSSSRAVAASERAGRGIRAGGSLRSVCHHVRLAVGPRLAVQRRNAGRLLQLPHCREVALRVIAAAYAYAGDMSEGGDQ